MGVVAINTKQACTNQGFITIIPNLDFNIYFLYNWLLTKVKMIQLLASGSTFPEIGKAEFRQIDFLVPSQLILFKYIQIIEPLFKKIEINTYQIQTLTKIRDSLLPKLMSGQIRVEE